MDGFLKNVGSSQEYISMQANLMGDAEASELAWGETYFSDCFDQLGKVITWVSRKQKPYARFQVIAKGFIDEGKLKCGAAMLKSVETRFASRHSMTERFLAQRGVYKALLKDGPFIVWLGKQKKSIREEVPYTLSFMLFAILLLYAHKFS